MKRLDFLLNLVMGFAVNRNLAWKLWWERLCSAVVKLLCVIPPVNGCLNLRNNMDSPSKILHVSEMIKGGTATYLNSLLQLQKQRDNRKLAVFIPASHAIYIDSKNLEVFTFPDGEARGLVRCLKFLFYYSKAINSYNPDKVHLHGSVAGFLCRFFFPSFREKYIYCSHGWVFEKKMSKVKKMAFRFVEKLLSHLTYRIVCISKNDYDLGLGCGIPPSKLSLVKNNVPKPIKNISSNELRFPGGENVIHLCFMGRFDYQKGLDILLTALKSIESDKVFHLHVIGGGVLDDTNLGDLQDVLSKLSTEYGWLSGEQSSEIIRRADALIMPSRWEGFGLVALESLYLGTPVICSDAGGLLETVTHGENGLVFKADDVQSLQECLRCLNLEDLIKMKEKLKDFDNGGYTMDEFEQKIEESYGLAIS